MKVTAAGSILIQTLLMTAVVNMLILSLLQHSVLEFKLGNSIDEKIRHYHAVLDVVHKIQHNVSSYLSCSKSNFCEISSAGFLFHITLTQLDFSSCFVEQKNFKQVSLVQASIYSPLKSQLYKGVISSLKNPSSHCNTDTIAINLGLQSLYLS